MNLILVTGGTGTLGRPLVQLLTSRGAVVRVLSRRPRPAPAPPHEWCTGDLRRGRGIEEAVAGAGTIIHCATGRGDIVAARALPPCAAGLAAPGRAAAAARRGGLLAPGHASGQVTFEDFLAEGQR
jgi:uncharacterized protein YbjT (DUF2867 family)